jgi:hypothetical protein
MVINMENETELYNVTHIKAQHKAEELLSSGINYVLIVEDCFVFDKYSILQNQTLFTNIFNTNDINYYHYMRLKGFYDHIKNWYTPTPGNYTIVNSIITINSYEDTAHIINLLKTHTMFLDPEPLNTEMREFISEPNYELMTHTEFVKKYIDDEYKKFSIFLPTTSDIIYTNLYNKINALFINIFGLLYICECLYNDELLNNTEIEDYMNVTFGASDPGTLTSNIFDRINANVILINSESTSTTTINNQLIEPNSIWNIVNITDNRLYSADNTNNITDSYDYIAYVVRIGFTVENQIIPTINNFMTKFNYTTYSNEIIITKTDNCEYQFIIEYNFGSSNIYKKIVDLRWLILTPNTSVISIAHVKPNLRYPLNDNFNFYYENGILTITRIDEKSGWIYNHSCELTLSFK